MLDHTGSAAPRQGRQRLSRLFATALLSSTIIGGSAAQAAVMDSDMVDVAGLRPITGQGLDNLRGGFRFGGFNINFGVTIKTSINNMAVLQTSFNVIGPKQIGDIHTTFLHDNKPAGGNPAPLAAGGNGGQPHIQSDTQPPSNTPTPANAPTPPGIGDLGTMIANGIENAIGGGAQNNSSQTQNTAPTNNPPMNNPPANNSLVSNPPSGPSNVAGATNTDPLPPTQNPNLQSAGQEGNGGFTLTQLPGGVHLSSSAGTDIIQTIDSGLMTQIINSANGATINHSTELTIAITNFAQAVNSGAAQMALNGMVLETVRGSLTFAH